MPQLAGKRIAILVDVGFEQAELTEPRQALEEAGAETHIVSPEKHSVRSWNKADWGEKFEVDMPLAEADPKDYDALVLPGGVMNPDHLRKNDKAVAFVKSFFQAGKPIAAICHGPWTLVEADIVKGARVTSYPSLKTDLRNAGAHWVDEEVVVDRGFITSRNVGDIPAFNEKMIEEFAKGRHQPAWATSSDGQTGQSVKK